MRDAVALVALVVELPVPLFWLLMHPAAEFWRSRARARYYWMAPAVWAGVALALLLPLDWWLEERFSRHPLFAVAGALLLLGDVWLISRVEHQAGWRVLVGLPELHSRKSEAGQSSQPRGQVVSAGIYRRLRHPRYVGMMLAWAGAVLLTGSTRLLVLVAGFMGLALLVTELEERELLARLGEDYAEYRRRVPRFLPR